MYAWDSKPVSIDSRQTILEKLTKQNIFDLYNLLSCLLWIFYSSRTLYVDGSTNWENPPNPSLKPRNNPRRSKGWF